MFGAAPGATLQSLLLYPELQTHTACSSFQGSANRLEIAYMIEKVHTTHYVLRDWSRGLARQTQPSRRACLRWQLRQNCMPHVHQPRSKSLWSMASMFPQQSV